MHVCVGVFGKWRAMPVHCFVVYLLIETLLLCPITPTCVHMKFAYEMS